MGRGPKPAKGKAKPAVSRKSPKNEGSRVHDLKKCLAEALQRDWGARPSDLPMEQAGKFDTIVNLRTARTLRLTIPSNVLLRTDSVIE